MWRLRAVAAISDGRFAAPDERRGCTGCSEIGWDRLAVSLAIYGLVRAIGGFAASQLHRA
jgi:hypothetical protein